MRKKKFLESKKKSSPLESTSNDLLPTNVSLDYSEMSEKPLPKEIILEEIEETLDDKDETEIMEI